MPTRRSFLLAALAGAALRLPVARAASGSQPREAGYVDLMPDFWEAYARAEGAADRVQALQDSFFAPHHAIYAAAGLKPRAERIARWLPDFDAMAADVRRIVGDFPAVYAAHATRFADAFPDFDRTHAPIYLLPALFAFDGHLEPGGEQLPLFIGADGLVRYHGASPDLAVFLDHESFHLYQSQVAPEVMLDPTPPVYAMLWTEGVATYVSERLNPDAALLHVLLDDARLAEADAATRRELAAAILAALDSTREADALRFFSAGATGAWPARGGYLIGLEVARRIGRELPLAQLPRLQGSALRERLARELATLAAGDD
ncbi:hypothetical protein OK348_02920 [Flavobacterium sp. MXW15]|uniref:DUF2268 domain-containing protein n=1 Tax=Xanthomonas chitinilytica TaxID=2989819 RepID=A0ABT3JRU1_9XANT|nr:hypothetical protein [Xanthomonas sp. H13-6]MCW4453748.1 hypothetical protein [Flavobacterium sp. MXW15]MCW4471204.1 hypothetical protein [Xanthomonas sp. H13-6]